MYSITSKAVATGVIALSLFVAAPVFADSNKGNDDNGLHLGAFARILRAERQDDRKQERRDDRKNDRAHATSTTATTTKQFSIHGTITFMNGSLITVLGAHGATYTVNASNATVVGHNNSVLTFAALAVNDTVEVKGSLVNNVVIATKVKDESDQTGSTVKPAKATRSISAGIVSAINGAAVTLTNFGTTGSTNLAINSATQYFVKGSATSSAALTNGAHVLVLGTTSATSTGTVNASVIVILTNGLNWIRHIFN